MNRTVFVGAHFKPTYKKVTVEVATGETKRGLFGGEKAVTREEKRLQQVGWSDREIDGPRLARDLDEAIQELNREDYEVISVTPVTSGAYRFQYSDEDISSSRRVFGDTERVTGGGSYGYGYGYSYTEGMLILARHKP